MATGGEGVTMKGMSSLELLDLTRPHSLNEHGGTTSYLKELYMNFNKRCKDFGQPLVRDVPSKAIEFCGLIINKVGPAARKVKNTAVNRVSRFYFKEQENGEAVTHQVIVSTHKSSKVLNKKDTYYMTLTIKEAELIAMDTLAKICEMSSTPIFMLTPLARAFFNKDDVEVIARDLGITIAETVISINQSAQTGGHHLPYSKASLAMVICIIVTKNMKDAEERRKICSKLTRQYIDANKILNLPEFTKLRKYAQGGVPMEYALDNICAIYEDERRMNLERMRVPDFQ